MDLRKLIKIAFYQIGIVLLLLLCIETITYFWNQQQNQNHPFLVDKSLITLKNYQELKGYGFYLIDPLLGWGYTDADLQKTPFETENHGFVLKTYSGVANPICIVITGGSTSDIGLDRNNWPVELCTILRDSGIAAKIHVYAIGGYSSGQELLKMVRDGIIVHPDIHISYSGANEHVSPRYTSRQEMNFYRNAFVGKKTPSILPNTFFALRRLLPDPEKAVELFNEEAKNPANFWITNMQIMEGLAYSNGYSFMAVLQPVLGAGNYTQNDLITKTNTYVRENKSVYPNIIKQIKDKTYIEDFTSIFDTCSGVVYRDDCHVNNTYQKNIARNVYTVLRKRYFEKGLMQKTVAKKQLGY